MGALRSIIQNHLKKYSFAINTLFQVKRNKILI